MAYRLYVDAAPAGLAERAWSPVQAAGDWSVFANQLGKQVLPALDRDKPSLAYRLPPPGLRVEGGQVWANAQMPGLSLRYTTDGSAPKADSPMVTGAITDKGTISVSTFSRNGRASRPSMLWLLIHEAHYHARTFCLPFPVA